MTRSPRISKINNKKKRQVLEEEEISDESLEQPIDNYFNLDKTDLIIIGLKIALWLIFWAICIEFGFGAVFFAISVLVFIYFNTGTRNKATELSAYSVFNTNCEQIQGTFSADKIEAQFRGAPGKPK